MKQKSDSFRKNSICIITLLMGLVCTMCTSSPKDAFHVEENNEGLMGRYLVTGDFEQLGLEGFYPKDSDSIMAPSYSSLAFKGERSPWYHETETKKVYPMPVHRSTGEIDTFFCFSNHRVCIGYINRWAEYENCLLVETKQPYKILKDNYLGEDSCCYPYNRDERSIHLQFCYNSEGQRIMFEAPPTDYWIAELRSPDIYGPLSIEEFRTELLSRGFKLPITLEGTYTRYVSCPSQSKELANAPYKGEVYLWGWTDNLDVKDTIIY